jgi:molecular chaperone HscC
LQVNANEVKATAGQQAIDVRFTYDINGILEVEVTVVSTGIKRSVVIEKNPGHMSKEEITAHMESLSHLKIHPRENHENKLLLARGERLYQESLGDTRQEIAKLLRNFEDVLGRQDLNEINDTRTKLKDIFDSMNSREDF